MSKTEVFDLASIDTVAACNNGAEIELKHPITNVHLGIFWTVLGAESDTFQQHVKDAVNARSRKDALAKKKGKDMEIRTVEEVERDSIDLITLCSVAWRTNASKNSIVFAGEELAFNVPNVRKVLTERPWIRKQVDEAIGELENFMKG